VSPESAGSDELVSFVRKRDYKLVRELGQGACGKTVLLYDELIDQHFVCKKYAPYTESERQQLFAGFVREVKLLHLIFHENIVRVYNHYLYPDRCAGYILMEHVDGTEIDDHVANYPEQTSDLFAQAVGGFSYLQRSGILHRDIRPGNLMVRADGVLKIIDLGFGKRVTHVDDFDKSISLNWWCEPPQDFQASRYDFGTEVYFVGKLFERLIQLNDIRHFKYMKALGAMCLADPAKRIGGFDEVERIIRNDQFGTTDFNDDELGAYRSFAAAICRQITKIESSAKYTQDIAKLQVQLSGAYRGFMLETMVPDSAVVLRCLVNGMYYYRKNGLEVGIVREFLKLLRAAADERGRVILANLHTRLDALPRYDPAAPEDDVPF
jgi:eukaryotic-like serine/threonine-protein kinase